MLYIFGIYQVCLQNKKKTDRNPDIMSIFNKDRYCMMKLTIYCIHGQNNKANFAPEPWLVTNLNSKLYIAQVAHIVYNGSLILTAVDVIADIYKYILEILPFY